MALSYDNRKIFGNWAPLLNFGKALNFLSVGQKSQFSTRFNFYKTVI